MKNTSPLKLSYEKIKIYLDFYSFVSLMGDSGPYFIPLISTDQGLFQQQYLSPPYWQMTPLRWLCYPSVKSSVCGKLESTLWHILLPRISLKVPNALSAGTMLNTYKSPIVTQALASVHLKHISSPFSLVTETWSPSSIYTLKISCSISPLKPTLSGAAQVP